MAFSYGWIDGVSFQVLKTYPSMVTGNLIQIGRSIEKIVFERYYRFSVVYWAEILIRNILVEIGCGLVGPLLCCYLKKQVTYRENSYAIIATMYFLSYFLVILTIFSSRESFETELTSYGNKIDDVIISQKVLLSKGHVLNTVAVTLMATSSGMMIFWSTKILYTTNLLTLNWMRFSEHVYKGLFNIHQGGAKMRGDMLIVIVISIGFTLGAILGILSTDVEHNLRQFLSSLCFIIVLYPLHMIFGYWIPHQERLQIAKKEKLEKMKNEVEMNHTMTNNPINKT